jgi:hypothetical protein
MASEKEFTLELSSESKVRYFDSGRLLQINHTQHSSSSMVLSSTTVTIPATESQKLTLTELQEYGRKALTPFPQTPTS